MKGININPFQVFKKKIKAYLQIRLQGSMYNPDTRTTQGHGWVNYKANNFDEKQMQIEKTKIEYLRDLV